MQTTKVIWQNGKLIPWEDAKIHVLTHTLHYGGGAFEGIRFYKTSTGPAVFRLPDHVNRLFYSAEILGMILPYSKDEITESIKEVVRVNHLDEGYIRPIAYYGYGKMGVNPQGAPVDIAIACWPWGTYLPHDCVDIKTSSYIRIHPASTVIEAKLSGHYVNGILATLELQGTHYHEALLLDSNDFISEGVGENFFLVKNNILKTPRLGTILKGITRDTVIQLAQILKLSVIEADIPLNEAYQADETFFTGTAAEITAIRSIDDKMIGAGNMGPITANIKDTYLNLVRGKYPDFAHYLTHA